VIAEIQEWKLLERAPLREVVKVARGATEAAVPKHQQFEEGGRSKLHPSMSPIMSRKETKTPGGNAAEVNHALAIAHEVYQALHDTMPELLAEAMKTMGIKKDP
jgi:hypothetical protein